MKNVLVTDGERRIALAIVRSLGKARFVPYVCSHVAAPSLAGASRFARGFAQVPNPLTQPAAYVAAVRTLLERWKIDILQPVSEQSYLAILGSRTALGDVRIAATDLDAFLALSDKARVLAAAREVGLATPPQLILTGPAIPHGVPLPAFPLVVKPTRTIRGGAWHPVQYADDVAALSIVLGRMAPDAFPVLLQRRIIGHGAGVSLLRWNGRLVASFAHRRIREYPPSGGISVAAESIVVPDELLARSESLLERFHWNGVAMVEFKVERGTNIPYVMEVNPRFWGSLQLAIDAGVDFPSLLIRALLGEEVGHVPRYRAGLRIRNWWGDLNHVLARIRHSSDTLSLPADTPSRLRVLGDFLRPHLHVRQEVLRREDPRPFLVETRAWLRFRLGL